MFTKLEEDLLRQLLVQNIDLKGRRCTNASDSQKNQDYVTRAELLKRTPKVSFGTLNPDQRPVNSVKNDIFIATDFNHTYIYTGSAWSWIDGGNDYVGWFRAAPGTGWHLCDGSANIRKAKSDGTTELITVPTLNAKVVARFDSSYSGPTPTAASAPTTVAHHHSVIVPDQNSADESAHTHSVSIANSVDVTTIVGTNNVAGAQTVSSGAGTAHHHDVPSQTFNSGDFTTIVNTDGHDKLMDGLPYIRL